MDCVESKYINLPSNRSAPMKISDDKKKAIIRKSNGIEIGLKIGIRIRNKNRKSDMAK